MAMCHNKHIVGFPIFAKPASMVLVSQLPNQLIQPLRHILWRLSALTAITPDVPVVAQPARLSVLLDLTRDAAFVVAVVPFAHGFGNLDGSVGAEIGCIVGLVGGVGVVPGEAFFATQVQEFEGALSAGAGGDVATGVLC